MHLGSWEMQKGGGFNNSLSKGEVSLSIKVVLKKVTLLTNNSLGENGYDLVQNARYRLEQWQAGRCYFHPQEKECSAKKESLILPTCRCCLLCQLVIMGYA